MRGIRAALQNDERFRTQIRALLAAAPAGALRILLPFVTTSQELLQARALIAEIARDMGAPGDVPVGAMIEVPAAALTVDLLARHADFLSVGTNDLIQYTLAIDRTEERRAGPYDPGAPAVLRLLGTIAAAGRRAQVGLSVCGEMAGDPVMVALLVGLGFRSFSMAPSAIPIVKQVLAGLDSRHAAEAARRARRAGSRDAAQALIEPLAEEMHRSLAADPPRPGDPSKP